MNDTTVDINSIVLDQPDSQSVANPIDIGSITFDQKTERPPLFSPDSAKFGLGYGLVPRVLYDLQNVDYHLTDTGERPKLVNSISSVTGLPTEEVDKYYAPIKLLFDAAKTGPSGAGADVSPSTTEGIINATMTPAIITAAAIDLPGTAAGLLVFTALDHIIPTPQFPNATKDEQASINLIGMIAKGAVVGGLFHGATKVNSEWFPDVLEKFGYKKLKENGLPDVIEVKPEQLIKLKGQELNPEGKPIIGQRDFTPNLGLKSEIVDHAISNNLSVKLPAEKLLKIATNNPDDFAKASEILSGKQPLEPIGTGEVKTSTLASGVEQKAIENKLTQGFGDLPEYRAMNMEEQAKLASDFLKKDPELAQKVAMGDALAPKEITPEAIFVAVENKAIKEGDASTLRDLAVNSKLTTEATAMGQRIATLATRDPESPTGAIKDLLKVREERVKKDLGRKSIEKAKSDVVKEIRSEIKKPRIQKQDWASFIKSLEC
jgi:hypothetical protein